MNIIVGFLLLCVLGRSTTGQDVGDSCHGSGGALGTCRYLTQCSDALIQIQSGSFPIVCGYEGTQVIVCCTGSGPPETPPRGSPPTSKPSPTTAPTKRTTVSSTIPLKPGDLSKEKCKEYGKYAYEESSSSVLIGNRPSRPILECPFEKEKLIVGGTKASRQEFPHMAQIGYTQGSETLWLCGGSLISPNFVLTAGHCLETRAYGTPTFVRVGITNQSDTYHAQTKRVVNVLKYPEYTFTKYHDIGLLKLESDFILNIYARPACLYTQRTFPVDKAIASGWGKQEFAGEGSRDLLKVVLEGFTAEFCNKTFKKEINQPDSELNRGILDDYMICYGSRTALKDTCQGDSGGPLQIYHPDTAELKCMYWIIGVTSFGKACGLSVNLPGVYTRVSNYIQWLENTVWR